MIDHMLFHDSYWIDRTSDVQNRLANYDNLNTFKQNVISSMNTMIANQKLYMVHHGQKAGTHYEPAVITINDNGYITFE